MSLTNKRILIVDDSRFSRWTLKQELERLGSGTLEAGEAGEALRIIHAEKPDAVILDLLMPGVSGLQLLERLREANGANPPVIILTADIQKSTWDRCRELGARAFLRKPVNPEELKTTLEGILDD